MTNVQQIVFVYILLIFEWSKIIDVIHDLMYENTGTSFVSS